VKLSDLIKQAQYVMDRHGDVPVLAAIGEWECVPASHLTVCEEWRDDVPYAVTLAFEHNVKGCFYP
jgi:hypothetical protein